MTLEEAIASYEKSAERYHKSFLHCKAHGGEFYQSEAESNKICYEHDRQLAAWLKILKSAKFEYDEAWRIITHPTPDVTYADKERAQVILDTFRDSLGRMDEPERRTDG
jgi:hypothetical protein